MVLHEAIHVLSTALNSMLRQLLFSGPFDQSTSQTLIPKIGGAGSEFSSTSDEQNEVRKQALATTNREVRKQALATKNREVR